MTADVCLRCDWKRETRSCELSTVRRAALPSAPARPGAARPPRVARSVPAAQSRSRTPLLRATVAGARATPLRPRAGPSRRAPVARSAVVAWRLGRAGGSALAGCSRSWSASGSASSPVPRGGPTGGRVLYAIPEGGGPARLWGWDLASGMARKGPQLREPLELGERGDRPASGGSGITSDRGQGVREASVLDILEVGASVRADWDAVTIVDLDATGRDGAARRPRAGARRLPSDGVGARRAGRVVAGLERLTPRHALRQVLPSDGRASGTSSTMARTGRGGRRRCRVPRRRRPAARPRPGRRSRRAGEMLVTPSVEFAASGATPRQSPGPSRRALLIRVPGSPSRVYRPYRGPPGRIWSAVDRCGSTGARVRSRRIGYARGRTAAVMTGRGLWELPLRGVRDASIQPARSAPTVRYTVAAYANDGTAVVAHRTAACTSCVDAAC